MITLARLTVIAALVFMALQPAHAQPFEINDGGMGRSHGVMPRSGPYRPINVSPTTGRTYSTEADYKAQRRSKRPPMTAR